MSLATRISAAAATLLLATATLVTTPSFAADAPVVPATSTVVSPADVPANATVPSVASGRGIVENPYGLDALWKGGDFVARGTLIILVLMSMGSWYIIMTKLIDHIRLSGQSKEARSRFWRSRSVPDGIETLAINSPYRYIAETGSNSTHHHDGALLEQIDLNTWVTMSIQRAVDKVQSRLQDGLAFLATVGSTAPFVGLFGTVWGIYHALTAIGIAGQASIDKVAGPVGEALIMTAIGLAVAVPAVLGYNFLVRRNKGAMEEVRTFSSDLHSVLLSGVMSSSIAAQAAAAKKAG